MGATGAAVVESIDVLDVLLSVMSHVRVSPGSGKGQSKSACCTVAFEEWTGMGKSVLYYRQRYCIE